MKTNPKPIRHDGTYLAQFRKQFSLKQGDVAQGMGISIAGVARIEQGEKTPSDEEMGMYLSAVAKMVPESRLTIEEFKQWRDSHWQFLDKPAFDHPDRKRLWDANAVLGEARSFCDAHKDDLSAAAEKMLKKNEEEIRRLSATLQQRLYRLAFIGKIGVGKTTMLCRLTGLDIADKKQGGNTPVLEVGGGGTTVCEVRIVNGHYGLTIEPCSDDEIEQDVDAFCEQLLPLAEKTEAGKSTGEGTLPRERERAIRNMSGLTTKRQGNTRIDQAKELVEVFNNKMALKIQILQRMRLPRRERLDIQYSPDSAKAPLEWLRDIFAEVNNGRHPEFSMPKRIDVCIPELPLGEQQKSQGVDIEIVDTKGIDQSARRSDLENQFHNRQTIAVLCSDFNAAPDLYIQDLLTRAKESGAHGIDAKSVILALPRPGEAMKVKEQDGTPAETPEDGHDIKKEQMIPSIQGLGVGNVPIGFFNAEDKNPGTDELRGFLLERVSNLRNIHREQLGNMGASVRDFITNYAQKEYRLALNEVARRFRVWQQTQTTPLLTDKAKIEADLLDTMRVLHASSIHASVKRSGNWYNLNYRHHFGVGSRIVVAELIRESVAEYNALAKNFLNDSNLQRAHNFIRANQEHFDSAVTDFLANVAVAGSSIFGDIIEKDITLWDDCAEEWGKGAGYRPRVTGHNTQWFEDDLRNEAYEAIKTVINKGWSQVLSDVDESLAVVKDGD